MKENTYLNDFHQICRYDPIKNEIKNKNIIEVNQLINEEFLLESPSTLNPYEKSWQRELIKKVENNLLESAKNNPENIILLLALRCRVSNLIRKSLINKFNKIDFKSKPVGYYDSLKRELYPNALVDNGQKFLKVEINNNLKEELSSDFKSLIDRRGIPINWNLKNIKDKIEAYNSKIIDNKVLSEKLKSKKKFKKDSLKLKSIKLPLGLEVILEFNNKLASLGTWVNIKFRSNSEIKEILDKFNIDSESYWSKIGNTITLSRLKEAWKLNTGSKLPKYLETLLISYKKNYPIAKAEYNDKNKRTYGWIPDEKFLKSLEPPQINLDNLKFIIKIYSWIERREITNNYDSAKNKEADEYKDFKKKEVIEIIFQFLSDNLQEIVNKKFDKMFKELGINPYQKCIWENYGKCLPQREIAILCGTSQTSVFRILKVKPFINDICIEILPSFEKKLNYFKKVKTLNKDHLIKSKFQNLDKEYLIEVLKEFSKKISNIRNNTREIDSYNEYFYNILTSPSKSDSIKKSTYFQELVRNYFKNE